MKNSKSNMYSNEKLVASSMLPDNLGLMEGMALARPSSIARPSTMTAFMQVEMN